MIPVQRLALEKDHREDGEDNERNHLLYHLQLHEAEGAAVLTESQPVGRNLAAILQQGNTPTEQNDPVERPVADNLHLLQLQVAIPGQRHKNVGYDK